MSELAQQHRLRALRRVFAGFVVLALIVTASVVTFATTRPEVLPVGAAMPQLEYQTTSGRTTLSPRDGRKTLLILFQSKCVYCDDELGIWNEQIDAVDAARIVLLTPEDSLRMDVLRVRWPKLAASSRTEWGTVSAADFEEKFGAVLTPNHFLFNEAGRLERKIPGLTNVERLVSVMNGKTNDTQ